MVDGLFLTTANGVDQLDQLTVEDTGEEARRILEKLEINYTPKHASWLNTAEIELSVLSRQRLDRQIPDQETLKKEVQSWMEKRNNYSSPMNWRFTTKNARIKLKKLYPTLVE